MDVLQDAPAEYFKEMVDWSLSRQHMKASDLTAFYLVNLLCRFVRTSIGDMSEPLAIQLTRALQSSGRDQRMRLRDLGDFTLFFSGFFSDSLKRKAVDVDYYVSMGEYAYGSLSRRDESVLSEVFGELSCKFVGFTDVLSDISEHSTVVNSTDTLRLYEKWLRTGSSRTAKKLMDRGIVPNASIEKKFIQ